MISRRKNIVVVLFIGLCFWQSIVWIKNLSKEINLGSSDTLHNPGISVEASRDSHLTHSVGGTKDSLAEFITPKIHEIVKSKDKEVLLEETIRDALNSVREELQDGGRHVHLHDVGSVPSTQAYVALCSIFKNEHGHLHQWIDYHRWLGVEKFYIFDHESSPPLSVELEEFVLQGTVELFYFSGTSWQLDADRYNSSSRQFLSPQTWAYDNCFRWFGKRHVFMGMLDADEYIVIREGLEHGGGQRPDLRSFLRPYEAYGGLVMQWQLMGPSGHVHRPQSETMLEYMQCMPKEVMQRFQEFRNVPFGFTKSFTNTKHYMDGCNPHVCALDGAKYMNEDMVPVTEEVIWEVHWSRIVVQHYVTRSIQDFELKMERGSGHSKYAKLSKKLNITGRGWNYFLLINDLSTGECHDGEVAYQNCCDTGACVCTPRSKKKELEGVL
ncbi:hypothetical protein CEUSTIGMA_g2362.t1 [Chlamydomonas eustigma]|uniref:Glycosyltransferase family 92 protein n=1 Tax=Chlamydomonas eustigma TaxID=1157962 RepID=A0A250WVX7_9CHLO|nr:hypothetical protein CEUSTIGMA_g2362.t1 [Chlamydomonas eustigma]|eukprot:GAX74916.1 hypothetical protein CEUSTIGMA_g2362.t1 [Chlamydomonas eustigma]